MSEDLPLFQLRWTRPAEFDVARILRYLLAFSEETATHFNDALDAAIAQEMDAVRAQIRADNRPAKRIDQAASVYNARPMFRLDIRTSPRRGRGQSSGLWYVYYALDDLNNDGEPDTFSVITVQHSTAQPLAIPAGHILTEGADEENE